MSFRLLKEGDPWTCRDMDEPWVHHGEGDKQTQKDRYCMIQLTDMRSPEKQIHRERDSQRQKAEWLGVKGMRSCYFMDTELQLGMMASSADGSG
jgi:hypothetical protein